MDLNPLDVEDLRADFKALTFEKATRTYYLAWAETLLGPAIVRIHGRKGRWTRTLPPLTFDTLDDAWPTIRAIIRKRLRNGYHIVRDIDDVKPRIRITLGQKSSPMVPMEQLKLMEE